MEEAKELKTLTASKVLTELQVPKLKLPLIMKRAHEELSQKINDIHPFDKLPATLKQLHQNGFHFKHCDNKFC